MKAWWIALIAIALVGVAWLFGRWWIVGGFGTLLGIELTIYFLKGQYHEDEHEYLKVRRRK